MIITTPLVDKIKARRALINDTITTVQTIAANTAYPDSFGAVGNGVEDDSVAIQTAIDSLGSSGGRIILNSKKYYRVKSNITINPSCHLEGQQSDIGSNGYNYYTNYDIVSGSIKLDSTATINMKSGSSISKVLLLQSNLTYLSPNSFGGTAITISGTPASAGNLGNTANVGDDVSIRNVMILGFNQAIFANNSQRLYVTDCKIDSNNGILINAAYDVPQITRVHCWPFSTIAAVAQGTVPNPNGNILSRGGTAFKFQNTVDWGKITDSFSYGYQRGFWIDSCNSCELTGCGADNVPEAGYSSTGQSGDIGFLVTGGSTDTLLTNCQSASNEKGFYIGTTVNVPTQLTNCVAWYNRDQAVLIEGGDVTILGGIYRNSQYGIKVTNVLSNVSVQTVRFSDIVSRPIESSSASLKMEGIHFENWTGGTPALFSTSNVSIPASNILVVPNEGNFFNVSSGTGLSKIQYGWPGRTVTLKFNSPATIIQSTGATGEIYLKSSSNTAISASNVLTVVSDGIYWYEK